MKDRIYMMIMNCNMRNREEFIYLWEYDAFKKKTKKTPLIREIEVTTFIDIYMLAAISEIRH